jgi:hypothetical protein
MAAVVLILRALTQGEAALLRLALCVGAGAATFAGALTALAGRQVLADARTLLPTRAPAPAG